MLKLVPFWLRPFLNLFFGTFWQGISEFGSPTVCSKHFLTVHLNVRTFLQVSDSLIFII